MNAQEFCYWLQGYFELLSAGEKTPEKNKLTAQQVEMIEQHLKYVFAEKTEPMPRPDLGTLSTPKPFDPGQVIC